METDCVPLWTALLSCSCPISIPVQYTESGMELCWKLKTQNKGSQNAFLFSGEECLMWNKKQATWTVIFHKSALSFDVNMQKEKTNFFNLLCFWFSYAAAWCYIDVFQYSSYSAPQWQSENVVFFNIIVIHYFWLSLISCFCALIGALLC